MLLVPYFASAQHFPLLYFYLYRYYTSPFLSIVTLNIFFSSSYLLLFLSLHHPTSPTTSISRYVSEINGKYFILFFNILQSAECYARILDGRTNVLDFLRSVQESQNHDVKDIIPVLHYKGSRRKHQLVVPVFRSSNVAFLCKLGAQPVR